MNLSNELINDASDVKKSIEDIQRITPRNSCFEISVPQLEATNHDNNNGDETASKSGAELAFDKPVARSPPTCHFSYNTLNTTNIVGEEITAKHEQHSLTYGFILGIQVMYGHNNRHQEKKEKITTNIANEINADDYLTTLEILFPPTGFIAKSTDRTAFSTPPHKLHHAFKFKDYMPTIFKAIRAVSGIDETDYMNSVAGSFNYIEFSSNSKSGQFFFYSYDGQYMIKTQPCEEAKFLRKIMPRYLRHLINNPNTLICRFYGMHRLKMKNTNKVVHFIIMSSVFDTPKDIHETFDLKGSTIGRKISDDDIIKGKVKKDLNWIEEGKLFQLNQISGENFIKVLQEDIIFFISVNVMDYSLLVGIHHTNEKRLGRRFSLTKGLDIELPKSEKKSFFKNEYGGIFSADETKIYFLGIIDWLQAYNTLKYTETLFKLSTFQKADEISCVDPIKYGKRFLHFLSEHTNYRS